MATVSLSPAPFPVQSVLSPKADARRNFALLPDELFKDCILPFLDFRAMWAASEVSLGWKNLTAEYAPALALAKQFKELEKTMDVYALLAFPFGDMGFGDKLAKAAFKEALKTSLAVYTFYDPCRIARTRGETAGEHNLIKLTGHDFRPPVDNLLLEERTSPYRLDKGRLFQMTPHAATTLCSLIAENPLIDALIIRSAPSTDPSEDQPPLSEEDRRATAEEFSAWSPKTFGDDVAVILANHLPAKRLKLLAVLGGYGMEGLRALNRNLPRLFENTVMDPKDINIAALYMLEGGEEDAERAELSADTQAFFTEKAQRNELVQRRDPCVIM